MKNHRFFYFGKWIPGAVMLLLILCASSWAVPQHPSNIETQGTSGQVTWLVTPKTLDSSQLGELTRTAGGQELITRSYGRSYLDVQGLRVNADKSRFLYLILDLPSPAQLIVDFTTPDSPGYSAERMVLVTPPTFVSGMRAYCLDMANIPNWSGSITALRLQMEGLMAEAVIGFGGIGVSGQSLTTLQHSITNSELSVTPVKTKAPYKGERMVACSRTVLTMDEVTAQLGLLTYVKASGYVRKIGPDYGAQRNLSLIKFCADIESKGHNITTQQAKGVKVITEPGILKAESVFDQTTLYIEAMPLRGLSDTVLPEGALIYRIHTEPAMPIIVRCGGMAPMHVGERWSWMRDIKVGNPANRLEQKNNTILLNHAEIPYTVGLFTSGTSTIVKDSADGPYASVRFDNGQGWIVATFAEDNARVLELAHTDVAKEEKETKAYFEKALNNFRISTPNPILDEAFRTAWLNMDYSWVKPYGCTESLHHWWSIWQQYHSASFDWAGVESRTRESIISHAQRQYKSGNIPYLLFFGEGHVDFGGNDQTFMWQVQHYLKTTGDKELAREILPNMRRLVDAFWGYEDMDKNGVPSFGIQILIHEDFIATPRDGTSSAVAGIEMWRTLALVERLAGNHNKAAACEMRAKHASQRWYEHLWQHELGRPAYYIDQTDSIRPDGQYHTLVLPVVYELLNPLEAYMAMRHLDDRLIGPNGEIYCSNNFPTHMSGVRSFPYGPTWGPQAGSYMQPWATWGFNRIGDTDKAIRSLEVVAQWATMFPHLDAWPESSTELTPAYFSNTAAIYAQTVIEALFGFQLDMPSKTLNIQPAFPSSWDQASINLAPLEASYLNKSGEIEYQIKTTQALRRRVRWPLPVCKVKYVEVNGKPHPFQIEPAVNGLWLVFETQPLEDSIIRFHIQPIEWRLQYPKSIAEGESMAIKAEQCTFVAIEDPTGVTESVIINADSSVVKLREGHLAPWLNYGRLGQLNFSRSSFFLKCSAQGQDFWAAIDFALLPRYIAACADDLEVQGQDYQAIFTLRNNTDEPLVGEAVAIWAGEEISLKLSIPPRNESLVPVPTTRQMLAALTPGDNPIQLILPNGKDMKFNCPVKRPFQDNSLSDLISFETVEIALPTTALESHKSWREFAAFPTFYHKPSSIFPNPLKSLQAHESIESSEAPGVVFPIPQDGSIAVASRRLGQHHFTVEVGQELRKIYLLVLGFVEHHDIFTECGHIKVTCKVDPARPPFDANEEAMPHTRSRYKKIMVQRRLYTPGDIDSWFSEYHAGPFATARLERPDRYGLLSLLGPDEGDWPEGIPLPGPYGMFVMQRPPRNNWPEGNFRSFPQPQYWASSPTIRTESATFNVISIDLGGVQHVESIEITCPLQDAALGVVSIVGIGPK